VLAKFRLPDEPLILVKLVGVGNSAPYDFHDKGTRSFIFRFESALEGHVLRVPLHLWQENHARLAHDLLDQRRLPHAIIVFLELPPVAQPPQPPSSPMGATDTRTETRIVVGPGSEPTVAPTFPLQASEASPATGSESSAATTLQAAPPPPSADRPLHEAAYDQAATPKRLKALAALLGVTEPALRTAITHPASQIELATAGWVRRKA
jgi:hypothetical protein